MKVAVISLHSPNIYLLCNYVTVIKLESEDTGVYKQRDFPHDAYILGGDRQQMIRK